MKWVSNVIITVGAISLLTVGAYLALQDKTASASAALGFGFLLVVLLLLAKFKRFRGFGFEAEMWDEKQVQAAVLVDKLTALAMLTSEQVALISAKLGLWSGGLTNPQMVALMKQADAVLEATGVGQPKRDEILAPIRDRIAFNFWDVARFIAGAGFKVEIEQARRKKGQDAAAITATVQRLAEERGKLDGLKYEMGKSKPTIEPIHSLAKTNLADHDRLLNELAEIEADLVAFQQTRTLRRDIDILALLQQNVW